MAVDFSAIARWPNVPACHEWLSLDRRGDWRLQGERVHGALGFGAGAEDLEEIAGGGAENGLGHVAAAGVAGAENEYFRFIHRDAGYEIRDAGYEIPHRAT